MSRETLSSTADIVIQAYNAWTLESVMSFRAPNCTHYILPSSLNRPPLNNEQYPAFFLPLMPAFKDFHLTVHDTIVDEVARKVVVHASSTATTALGPYKNEYTLILHMTEDGRQVERFYEFVDSAKSVDQIQRVRDFIANQQKGEGDGP